MKRIITYNVNGIRAALNKNWIEWLKGSGADVVCLQEIKAHPEQLDLKIFEEAGYHHYWYPAQKKGYSGVAILCKQKPDHVGGFETEMGDQSSWKPDHWARSTSDRT